MDGIVEVLIFVVLLVVFAFVGSAIGQWKGRRTAGFLLGLLLGPLGCLIALCLERKTNLCPRCKTSNSAGSKFCSACSTSLDASVVIECPYCQKRFPV
jgi:hypothetical protein